MLRGVNDNPEQAHELGALLKGRNVVQNLIPWNPIYRCPRLLRLVLQVPAGEEPPRQPAPIVVSDMTAARLTAANAEQQAVTQPHASPAHLPFRPCWLCLRFCRRPTLSSQAQKDDLHTCSPTISFQAPGPERTLEFQRILKQEYGVPTTIRKEKVSGWKRPAESTKHETRLRMARLRQHCNVAVWLSGDEFKLPGNALRAQAT